MDTFERAREEALRRRALWQPRRVTGQELEALAGSALVDDTLAEQWAELLDTRAVGRPRAPTPDPLPGAWFHFPWSNRLVHVLPEPEFRELRASRNQHRISAEEAERLASLTVAVVGLSVGQATAVTLGLEGVGRRFRLADFDTLSLSNMNRLRAGVQDIGVNKAILTARQLFEIDPWLEITIEPAGLTADNIGAFLDGVDLCFEECDGLEAKVRVREEARRRRIPVIMETSDRGMLDVERFDREPDRPLFHGLAGELRAAELGGLDTYAKVPIVLAILGVSGISDRLAASLVDIDSSLKTWPQLASAVALGGALNAEVGRRVALGKHVRSGRWYVDLEALLGGDPSASPPPILPDDGRRLDPGPLPAVPHAGPDAAILRALCEHAMRAPSGGNSQPWRFEIADGVARCRRLPERAATFLDHGGRASFLACGASAENLVVAARAAGHAVELRLVDDELVYEARLAGRVEPGDQALAAQIGTRVTNRRLARREPLPGSARAALERAAAEAGGRLVVRETDLDAIADLLGAGDRVRLLSRRMHDDMFRELRWTRAEAEATRDGIDVATLELDATSAAALRLLRRWPVMETLREVGGGKGLERGTRKAVAASSAVGLVEIAPHASLRETFFQGGRVVERVWLTAGTAGVAVQPMTALLYMLPRLDEGSPGLDPAEAEALRRLGADVHRIFDVRGIPLMLMRFSLAEPPAVRSLRRTAEEAIVDDAAR
jgi:nitroreductase